MNGCKALACNKAAPNGDRSKVIAISAAATDRDARRGISAGSYAYLAKPLNVAKLLRVIKSAIVESAPEIE